MKTIDESRAAVVVALQGYEAVLDRELTATRLAIRELNGAPAPAATAAPANSASKPRKSATRKAAKAKRQPKKTVVKAQKKFAARRPAPRDIADPTTRKGRLPTRVQVKTADDLVERKAMVADLMKRGYTRAKIGERLAPGLFDVNHRDGGVLVTWWPKEGEGVSNGRAPTAGEVLIQQALQQLGTLLETFQPQIAAGQRIRAETPGFTIVIEPRLVLQAGHPVSPRNGR